jgi:hypothetical protein
MKKTTAMAMAAAAAKCLTRVVTYYNIEYISIILKIVI